MPCGTCPRSRVPWTVWHPSERLASDPGRTSVVPSADTPSRQGSAEADTRASRVAAHLSGPCLRGNSAPELRNKRWAGVSPWKRTRARRHQEAGIPSPPMPSRIWKVTVGLRVSLGIRNSRMASMNPRLLLRMEKGPEGPSRVRLGGPEGNRTPDLFHAKEDSGG
jgi:hypothetical protein